MNMNPEEAFAPYGVDSNPSCTPTLPHRTASPPPGVSILYDHTDAMGITTVMIAKEIPDVDPRIPLKHVPHMGLVLGDFGSESILKGTHLCPTMTLLSINGCDCSSMTVDEATALLWSSSNGEITLQAVHSQVLLWPTAEGQSRNLVLSALPELEVDPTTHSSPSTSTTTPPPQPPPTRSTTPPPHIHQKVKVIVQKSNKRSSVGLVIVDEPLGDTKTTTVPVIERIDPRGLCANTALQEGMRIWSVNGLVCYTKDDTMTKLKRAKGICHIEAQVLPGYSSGKKEETEHHPAEHDSPQRTTRGVRSLTPPKWLPSFHRAKQHPQPTKVKLIPTKSGESA